MNRTSGSVMLAGGFIGALPPVRVSCALRCPPLSCRTSPPQGGRLSFAAAFANHRRRRAGGGREAADLPPGGGDVRQDRGGQRRARSFPMLASQLPPCHPRFPSAAPAAAIAG